MEGCGNNTKIKNTIPEIVNLALSRVTWFSARKHAMKQEENRKQSQVKGVNGRNAIAHTKHFYRTARVIGKNTYLAVFSIC